MAYPLTAHNTFGIAATCNSFFEYASVEELQALLPQLNQQRWLHIGAGSNLLFVHPHFDGVILHSGIKGWERINETDTTVDIRVGAGEEMDAFIAQMIDQGYYGLENLSHIPGEVGASAVQNVGAYGVEAGDFIVSVEALEVATQQVVTLQHDDCHYSYRFSEFKGNWRGKYIITQVTFRLKKTFTPILSHKSVPQRLAELGIPLDTARATDLRKAIIDIRSAKLPDPKVIGSAGSFFMNPIVTPEVANNLLERFPNMPHYAMPNGVKIPAGWLIEQAEWKGKSLGNAGVHPQQALVLINKGGATGEEIAHLARTIQQDVKQKFGIMLHPEVMFL